MGTSWNRGMNRRARATWYRLDNVGSSIRLSQAGSSAQTVFLLFGLLVDEVDPEVLQHALGENGRHLRLQRELAQRQVFWHYLEQATKPPVVQRENLPICFGLHVDAKSILFA